MKHNTSIRTFTMLCLVNCVIFILPNGCHNCEKIDRTLITSVNMKPVRLDGNFLSPFAQLHVRKFNLHNWLLVYYYPFRFAPLPKCFMGEDWNIWTNRLQAVHHFCKCSPWCICSTLEESRLRLFIRGFGLGSRLRFGFGF